MTPLQTPPLQAAYDHAWTAMFMLIRHMNDNGLDADALAARSHLIEVLAGLNASLTREDGQRWMDSIGQSRKLSLAKTRVEECAAFTAIGFGLGAIICWLMG